MSIPCEMRRFPGMTFLRRFNHMFKVMSMVSAEFKASVECHAFRDGVQPWRVHDSVFLARLLRPRVWKEKMKAVDFLVLEEVGESPGVTSDEGDIG